MDCKIRNYKDKIFEQKNWAGPPARPPPAPVRPLGRPQQRLRAALLLRPARAPLARRKPPLTPSAFAEALGSLDFFDRLTELPAAAALYEAAYAARLGEATQLFYSYSAWGDEEAAQLAAVLRSGVASEIALFASPRTFG